MKIKSKIISKKMKKLLMSMLKKPIRLLLMALMKLKTLENVPADYAITQMVINIINI